MFVLVLAVVAPSRLKYTKMIRWLSHKKKLDGTESEIPKPTDVKSWEGLGCGHDSCFCNWWQF